MIVRQPVIRHLLADEVLAGNRQLLLFRVARQLEHFHAVAQRVRDRVEDVGGRDEQHLRQIEGHVEVVVAERRVLFRIEHFE